MELFPPMPLASWQDTKQTLHRFCQGRCCVWSVHLS
jgi:hypothetical protein